MSASTILDTILAQHASLCRLMHRCITLDGEAQLDAIDELRCALDAHNRCEERLLRGVLGDDQAEQMYLDHICEHLAVNEQFHNDALDVAMQLLGEHLDDEESYLIAELADEPVRTPVNVN